MSWFPWQFGGDGYIEFPSPSDGGPSFGSVGKIYVEFEWTALPYSMAFLGQVFQSYSRRHPQLFYDVSNGVIRLTVANDTTYAYVSISASYLRPGSNRIIAIWSPTEISISLNGNTISKSISFTPSQPDSTLQIFYPPVSGLCHTLKAWSNPNAPLDSTPDILNLGPQSGSNVFNLANPSVMGTAYGNCSCLIKPARKGFRPLTSGGYCQVAHHGDLSFSQDGGCGVVVFNDGHGRYCTAIKKYASSTNRNYHIEQPSTNQWIASYSSDNVGHSYIALNPAFLTPNYNHIIFISSTNRSLLSTYANGKQTWYKTLEPLDENGNDIVIAQSGIYGPAYSIPLAYILNKNITGYEPTDEDVAQLELYLAMGNLNEAVKILEDKTVGLWLLTSDTLEGSPGNYYFPDLSVKGESHPAQVQGTKDVDWELVG